MDNALNFKVYVNGNREYFVIGKTKKDFDFAKSLLDLVDLDIWSYGNLFDEMGKAVRELRQNENIEKNIALMRKHLNAVSKIHVYFEQFKMDWNSRLDEYATAEEKKRPDLPIKKITHVPSNIQTMQQQIKDLIKNVLDVISEDEPVQKKIVKYYDGKEKEMLSSLDCFEFQEQSTNFEKVDSDTFTEVLYPKDIYDIIDFILRACIKQEQPFKVCKSCGRYFAIYSHANSEYCNRLFQDTDKTCKEIGSVKVYQAKVQDNPAIKAYNKAYKTHFARIKYKHLTKEEFQAWAELAREFRDKCLAGDMDLQEYETWLKY